MINEAMLLLTRRCNYHCSFCRIAHKPISELPLELWQEIIRILKTNYDVRTFGISGGEATLLPNLLVGVVQEISPYPNFVISNGAVIDTEFGTKLGERLLLAGLTGYSSSVDDEHLLHSKDHGLNSMLKMKELGCQDVTASLTIYSGNVKTLVQTIKKLTDLGIYSVISIVHATKQPFPIPFVFRQDDVSVIPTYDEICYFVDEIIREYPKLDLHAPIEYFENLPKVYDSNGLFKWHCEKPHYIEIDSDGKIKPCPDLLSGLSILETSIDEMLKMWYNDTSKCPGCYYSCEYRNHTIVEPISAVFKRG